MYLFCALGILLGAGVNLIVGILLLSSILDWPVLVWRVLGVFGVRMVELCLDVVDVSIHSRAGSLFDVVPLCFGAVLAGNVHIHFRWKCTCPLSVCDHFRPNVLTL